MDLSLLLACSFQDMSAFSRLYWRCGLASNRIRGALTIGEGGRNLVFDVKEESGRGVRKNELVSRTDGFLRNGEVGINFVCEGEDESGGGVRKVCRSLGNDRIQKDDSLKNDHNQRNHNRRGDHRYQINDSRQKVVCHGLESRHPSNALDDKVGLNRILDQEWVGNKDRDSAQDWMGLNRIVDHDWVGNEDHHVSYWKKSDSAQDSMDLNRIVDHELVGHTEDHRVS